MPEASLEHHDTAGVRRPQTRRAGRICAKFLHSKLRPGHQPDLRFELDLDAMHLGRIVQSNQDGL